jgi:hypothetical protein
LLEPGVAESLIDRQESQRPRYLKTRDKSHGKRLLTCPSFFSVDATFASLLEITDPVFIILFTGLFLRKLYLSLVGSIGAVTSTA